MDLEEGEAYSYQNHNDYDDDSAIDPDIALSYIDEKIQDVLGHFQKDFEGGVSAENLGAKFGGYGSFLPTYQRSPVAQSPQTPQKNHSSNTLRSQNNLQLEGMQTNSVVPSSSSLLLSRGSTSATLPSTNPLKDSANFFSKRNERTLFGPCAEVSSSGWDPDNNFSQASERSFRVRIKVGSDNISAEKKAEMYSGLGLDTPSVSPDGSPVSSEELREPFNPPEESPTSILQIMTSFPVHSNPLLSPLPQDLIFLSEKQKFQGERIQALDAKHSARVKGGNKHKSSRKKDFQLELKNKATQNGNGLLLKKERRVGNLTQRGLVEDSEIRNKVKREWSSDTVKRENLEAATREVGLVELPSGISGIGFKEKVESINDSSVYPKKDGYPKEEITRASITADSDICYGKKSQSSELVDRSELNATSLQEDSLASRSKNKSKGSRSQVVHSAEVGKKSSNMDSSLTPMERESKHVRKEVDSKPRNDLGKVRDTYRDFFGDMELEQNDDDVDSEDMISDHMPGKFKVVEKSASTVMPKVTSSDNKREKSSISIPNEIPKAAPAGDPRIEPGLNIEAVAGAGAAVPVVHEDWVCCDKCHQWRLLPLGTNPNNLPEKWLCSMLDWLPGMNKCSFSEDETTKALVDLHQLPAPRSGLHGSSLIDSNILNGKGGNGGIDGLVSAKRDFRHISNSTKNSIAASVKGCSLNDVSQSPLVTEIGNQRISKHSAVEKHRHKQKSNRKRHEQPSERGEIREKRDAEPGCTSVSKKAKVDNGRMSDHDRPSGKVEMISSTGLPLVAGGKNQHKNDDHHSRDRKSNSSNRSKDPSRNFLRQTTERKRKSESRDLLEATSENDDRKEKKTRVTKSAPGEDTRVCKGSGGSKKARTIKEEQYVPDLGLKSLKRDLGSTQPSQATSSSSKVSGSHHKATISKEVKGSPVGSVSSSPGRFLNQEKCASLRNLDGKDDFRDAALFNTDTEAKILLSSEVANCSLTEDATGIMHNGNQHPLKPKPESSDQLVKEKQRNIKQSYTNVSRPKKGSSLRSKSKNGASQTERDQDEHQISNSCDDYVDHTPYGKKRRHLKNSVQEQVIDSPVAEQALHIGKGDSKIVAEHGKRDSQLIYRGNNRLDDKVEEPCLDQKQNLRPDHFDVSSDGPIPHELPLAGRGQSDTATHSLHLASGAQKENETKSSITDGTTADNTLRAPKPTRRPENLSGNQPTKSAYLTPSGHKINDVGTSSPARRDSSSQAGNSALKEAKDLKHLADRLKNSGSSAEGTSLYFQAALKFLHGASLLELCNSENAKKSEVIVAMQVYSSTAKLCEFCAREYERCKDFAAAALAYKLMEVAYMRVIYFSNANASRDRHELQTALQIVPLGESPSSSVSEIDNVNNPATIEKTPLVNGVGSPQVIGNHSIAARNRPSLARVLNFAQDVNYAMEASRKSRSAYAAVNSSAKESQGREGISSVKKALDFSFHDMERLLKLVRLAMDGINR